MGDGAFDGERAGHRRDCVDDDANCVVRSCAMGIVTSFRKPPVHEISRTTARCVMLGAPREMRVSGVRTASFKLLCDVELSLNHVVAPGVSKVVGSDTSSA